MSTVTNPDRQAKKEACRKLKISGKTLRRRLKEARRFVNSASE